MLSQENKKLQQTNHQLSNEIANVREENKELSSKVNNIMNDSPAVAECQSTTGHIVSCDEKFEDLYSKLNSFAESTQRTLKDLEWKSSVVNMHREIDLDAIYEPFETISSRLLEAEKEIISTNQYIRRNNLVLNGILDTISHNDLQSTCEAIINSLGYYVSDYEIEGCHRLPNKKGHKTAPVIVGFTNRKVVEYVIKNRTQLSRIGLNYKVYANEDLNRSNEEIKNECIKLQKMKLLTKFTMWNGKIKVTVNPGDFPIPIAHLNDLEIMFPDSAYT